MSDKYYLGFDAGTQSVKVAVYDEDQHCLAMDTAKTHLAYPHPGWVQMDVDEYYRLIKQCMASCSRQMEEKGWDVKKVRAIMGDGIICGIAGIDADGNAITPYVNYLDSRTADDVEALKAKKLAIWGEETGNAEPNIMFPAMFARWFMKNIPAWQEKGVKFVHNCPYVLMHLAGLKGEDAFIDWGAMSGWGLGYDVVQKKWSPEQLEILGIPETYMPRIVKPWDIIGTLCEEDAMETGFPAGIPICAGAGDTMESMMGSGILEAGRAGRALPLRRGRGLRGRHHERRHRRHHPGTVRTGEQPHFQLRHPAGDVFLLGHGPHGRPGPALVQGQHRPRRRR